MWSNTWVIRNEAGSVDNVRTLQGDLLARDLRFTIVASRFNELIVESLIRACVDTLLRHGASEVD